MPVPNTGGNPLENTGEFVLGPAVPFSIPAASGAVPGSVAGEYLGFTVSAAAAATVVVRDGSASGAILDTIDLAAAGSITAHYPRPGRQVLIGLYCVVTGAPSGSLFQ